MSNSVGKWCTYSYGMLIFYILYLFASELQLTAQVFLTATFEGEKDINYNELNVVIYAKQIWVYCEIGVCIILE